MTDSGAERAARRINEWLLDHHGFMTVEQMAAIISEETGTQWRDATTDPPDHDNDVQFAYQYDGEWIQLINRYVNGHWESVSQIGAKWQPLPPAPEEGGTR